MTTQDALPKERSRECIERLEKVHSLRLTGCSEGEIASIMLLPGSTIHNDLKILRDTGNMYPKSREEWYHCQMATYVSLKRRIPNIALQPSERKRLSRILEFNLQFIVRDITRKLLEKYKPTGYLHLFADCERVAITFSDAGKKALLKKSLNLCLATFARLLTPELFREFYREQLALEIANTLKSLEEEAE